MDNLLAHCVNFYDDLPVILAQVPGVQPGEAALSTFSMYIFISIFHF